MYIFFAATFSLDVGVEVLLTEAGPENEFDSELAQISRRLKGAPVELPVELLCQIRGLLFPIHLKVTRCQQMSPDVKSSLSKAHAVRQLEELGIDSKDLEESFTRSSGPGGQNVNKESAPMGSRFSGFGIGSF